MQIGILGLLGLLFVALKLTGVIAWSWWWVTAPFWGGLTTFQHSKISKQASKN